MNRNVRKRNQPCAPIEDSDQTARSRSLIRIFSGCVLDSQGCKVSPCVQRKLCSDYVDAQADLSLRSAHMSEGTFFYHCGSYGRSFPTVSSYGGYQFAIFNTLEHSRTGG